MNLYFPDAWTARLADQLTHYAERKSTYPGHFAGYCAGIADVDASIWGYAAGLTWVRMGYPVGVPAWVYTHERNPYTNGGK